jgi:predicted Rossmann fold nucleotide-binding protein DprA/Smf involved in DNA uptake
MTDCLIEELSAQNILIISGMAYGWMPLAHKAARQK